MIEVVGWVGAICFALCGLPQAVHSYRTKASHGVTWGMLGLWTVGEILTLWYILATTAQGPLILNYVFNLACLGVIIRYKIGGEK